MATTRLVGMQVAGTRMTVGRQNEPRDRFIVFRLLDKREELNVTANALQATQCKAVSSSNTLVWVSMGFHQESRHDDGATIGGEGKHGAVPSLVGADKARHVKVHEVGHGEQRACRVQEIHLSAHPSVALVTRTRAGLKVART